MTNAVPITRIADLTRDFTWGQVPTQPEEAAAGTFAAAAAQPLPPLGPLANLAGTTFRGKGFNTIFRPQNFATTPTPLPTAPDSDTNPDDNILELNLTEEILEFSSPLGSVPNRGFVQGDIALNGVPYVQRIKDVTNPGRSVGIHFEPGVWLNVPQTDDPAEGPTVVRMASIPHGTTIEAQGTSFSVPGPPTIDSVDITPSVLGSQPVQKITFPSQDPSNSATFRIPQDLTPFVANGTITKSVLTNPNSLLHNRIASQNITGTTVITIDTDPGNPLLPVIPPDPALVGGGTDNIAFLQGTQTGPNADAVQMGAIFWVETVADHITVPALQPGESVTVTGTDSAGDGLVPSFTVTAETAIADGTAIDVSYTQLQYTQLVQLNFNGLGWPHVSVATLIPADPIVVQP